MRLIKYLFVPLFVLTTLLLSGQKTSALSILELEKRTDILNVVKKPLKKPKKLILEPQKPLEYKLPKRKPIPGNTYYKCQCTYYAKMKRPDLPNHLGNADRWYQNLKARGWYVGDIPIKGAIVQFKDYMHVAYSEKIEGDMVLISEWNYSGPCVLTYRWVPASSVYFIY